MNSKSNIWFIFDDLSTLNCQVSKYLSALLKKRGGKKSELKEKLKEKTEALGKILLIGKNSKLEKKNPQKSSKSPSKL